VGVPGLDVTLPPPPPPPQPASPRASSNPAPRSASDVRQDGARRRQAQAAAAKAAKRTTIMGRPLGEGGAGGRRGEPRGATSEPAVVETETVMLVPELSGVSWLGETVHVASEGAPLQVKLTAWLRPPRLPTAKV